MIANDFARLRMFDVLIYSPFATQRSRLINVKRTAYVIRLVCVPYQRTVWLVKLLVETAPSAGGVEARGGCWGRKGQPQCSVHVMTGRRHGKQLQMFSSQSFPFFFLRVDCVVPK